MCSTSTKLLLLLLLLLYYHFHLTPALGSRSPHEGDSCQCFFSERSLSDTPPDHRRRQSSMNNIIIFSFSFSFIFFSFCIYCCVVRGSFELSRRAPPKLGQIPFGTILYLGEIVDGAHPRRLIRVASKYGVHQQARGYRVRLSLGSGPPHPPHTSSITIIMNVGNNGNSFWQKLINTSKC